MIYEGRTMAEAVRKWHHDALPHVSALSLALGIPMNDGQWYENPSDAGYFTRDGRDVIAFHGATVDKTVRKIGDARHAQCRRGSTPGLR